MDVLASFPFDSARRRSTVLCQICESQGDVPPASKAWPSSVPAETPDDPHYSQTRTADSRPTRFSNNSLVAAERNGHVALPLPSSPAVPALDSASTHALLGASSHTEKGANSARETLRQSEVTESSLVTKEHFSRSRQEPSTQVARAPDTSSAGVTSPLYTAVQADAREGGADCREGHCTEKSSLARRRVVLFCKGADVVILPRLRKPCTRRSCLGEPGARKTKGREVGEPENRRSGKQQGRGPAAGDLLQEEASGRLKTAGKPTVRCQSPIEETRAGSDNEDGRSTSETAQTREKKVAGLSCKHTSRSAGSDREEAAAVGDLTDQEEFRCRQRMENALEAYAAEGLRTLCIAKKVLGEAEFAAWYEEFSAAEVARGSDKQSRLLG